MIFPPSFPAFQLYYPGGGYDAKKTFAFLFLQVRWVQKNGISAKLKHIQRRRLALCSNISTLAPACRTLASVEPVWPMACLSGFNRQFEHFQHV
jgi:hypothetical protein